MLMQWAIVLLACFVCIGQGRRMQTIGQFQGKLFESQEQSLQSLAELSQASVTTGSLAWNPTWRLPHISQPNIRESAIAISNVPAAPSTARFVVVDGDRREKEDTHLNDIVMTPLVGGTQEPIKIGAVDNADSNKTFMDQGHISTNTLNASQEEKWAWCGAIGKDVLILMLAKLCTRIALFFRKTYPPHEDDSFSQGPSVGVQRAPSISMVARSGASPKKRLPFDLSLIICVAAWYLGNYHFNVTNKLALNATGGAVGFPLTIATLQLGIGVIYAAFLWLAPDARSKPKITFEDYKATLPVAAAAAAAHFGVVFSSSAASVSFAQIVFAIEPVFAALIGTLLYKASISTAKLLSLIPIIGGVCLALYGEVHFAWVAFVAALFTNAAAALRVNEHKKLMNTEGITERLGSVGNQYALTTINMFLMSIPVALLAEGRKLGAFMSMCRTSPVLIYYLVFSGLSYYLYSEIATVVIKKAGPVTQSVLNCAKRAIIITAVAFVLGEGLGALKLIGSGVSIAGVLLYSVVDDLFSPKAGDGTQRSPK